MEKRNIRSFKIRWYILVLLLVSLIASMALNVYLYFEAIKPSTEYGINTLIVRDIQGGMGSMHISIGIGMIAGLGCRFNVSVGVKLWEPYTGSATYNFCFRLYERSEQDDKYQDTPIAEKTVVAQKDKDAMYVIFASGNLTITTPSTRGIYIYKICLTGTDTFETEFPIWVEEGMLLSPII